MKHFFLLIISLFLGACASSTNGGRGSSGSTRIMRSPNLDTRAHPAAYLVERFEVPKEIEERDQDPVPFYFKDCSQEIGDFIMTNSRYDCDYR